MIRKPRVMKEEDIGAFELLTIGLLTSIAARVYEPAPYTILTVVGSLVLIVVGMIVVWRVIEWLEDKWKARGVPDGE